MHASRGHSRQERSNGRVAVHCVLRLGFQEVASGAAEEQEESKHSDVVDEGLEGQSRAEQRAVRHRQSIHSAKWLSLTTSSTRVHRFTALMTRQQMTLSS